jgi:hypothetical protein
MLRAPPMTAAPGRTRSHVGLVGVLRLIVSLSVLASANVEVAHAAIAQGLTTVGIRGDVRAADGTDVSGAHIRIMNAATGSTSSTRVQRGRFFVQGLEPGGPYIIEVRQVGFLLQRSERLTLRLGEPVEIRFVLRPVATALDTVLVSDAHTPGGGGTATLIPESLIDRLPTLNRNFYDFVILAPQVSTKVGSQRRGVSAAGANQRFNNFLINGADERLVNGNVSAGANDGKSIPLDAVKEYQVLVAPYDVRYGDFAGALVNTISQSGTNELHGSLYAYWRNDRLARGGELAPTSPYEQMQYGLSLGGPLVRDRVHFFIAPEIQHLASPARGPYAGQPASSPAPMRVNDSDLARLEEIMRGYGLTAGSAGAVEVKNPLRNIFARVDAAIPILNSRIIAFVSSGRSENENFARTASDTFPLASYKAIAATALRLTSLQLHTDFPGTGGGHNELILSHMADRQDQDGVVRQPLVYVRVDATSGNPMTLSTGPPEQSHGRFGRSRSWSLRNNLSLPLGARHVVLLGIEAGLFSIDRGGVRGGYGTWTFASLDALEHGDAASYTLKADFEPDRAPVRGDQDAAYLSDSWRATDHISVTAGIRADRMNVWGHAPYSPRVDELFGRRTDRMPRPRLHLSPRIGFNWDVAGAGRDQLRGGIGIFTGRPPRGWYGPAITNYGLGIGELKCGTRPTDTGPAPLFVPDYRAAPTACATGLPLGATPSGDVDLLASDLRMAQALRTSIAWDRRLSWGITATTEAVVSRYLSDFMFVNLNLEGPRGVDRFGRVMYGTIDPTGIAQPALVSTFSGVIDLRNTSRNHSYQLSTRLEKRFEQGFAAVASYTFSRARDVQSPSRINMPGTSMWADARAVSGRHDDFTPGISLNDLPHRTVVALSYTAPWQRWSTGASLHYVGESGSPFTYLAWGSRRGDLNADGSGANDPIYVPRTAFDPTEIMFSGEAPGADNSPAAQAARVASQQATFESFIQATPCLRRQRGRLLERNSCREPWTHTTVASLRQSIPIGGQGVEAELDVFNVLNLLNGRWGRFRVAEPFLLEHVGHTPEAPETTQPIFRADATRLHWTTLKTESAFQLQLAMRYRF